MNACEAEILSITKYEARKSDADDRQKYLMRLLKALDALPYDVFMHQVSNQAAEWFNEAVTSFKAYKPLPELPELTVESLSFPWDDENYVEPEDPKLQVTPEEHRGNIAKLLVAQEVADKALDNLEEATNKVRPKRHSKYRQAHPTEGARYYLDPRQDRFGLIIGSQRHVAATLFERGATMKQVKEVTGYSVYNLLRKLREDGHRIENAGGVIKLTHKDDLELKP